MQQLQTSQMPLDTDELLRDQQLAEELDALREERAQIIAGTNQETREGIEKLNHILNCRLQLASDFRQYQLANTAAASRAEKQHAWNEFEHGKSGLRQRILAVNAELRKRLEAVRMGG